MTPGASRQLPRDLIDEIAHELDSCSRQLTVDSRRATGLLELHAEAGAAAARLGRPLTVFDYLDGARGPGERTRRAAQLNALRAHDAWHEPSEERAGPDSHQRP
jgi:hypothetical protein